MALDGLYFKCTDELVFKQLDHDSWIHLDILNWYDRDSSRICELENLEISPASTALQN